MKVTPLMNGKQMLRLVAWLACLALIGLGGCATWGEKKPKATLGILPPSEEMKLLKGVAERAPSMPPEQKQRYTKLLTQAIQKEKDPLVRCEILRTLAALPSPTSTTILVAALKDPDSQVRMTACEMVAKQHDPAVAARIAEVLTGDTDGDVRLAAATALGQCHDPAALPALGQALEDKDPAMQRRAVLSLKAVTGKDLGNDVTRWRAYIHNQPLPPDSSPTLAQRFQQLF